MKIRCFAMTRTEEESTGDFLLRLAAEIKKLEESVELKDIVINFPSRIDPKERATAVVFFDGSSDEGYDMDYVEFKTSPHESAVDSLRQNLETIQEWLEKNKSVEVYDVSVQTSLDRDGRDVTHSIVYYGPKGHDADAKG